MTFKKKNYARCTFKVVFMELTIFILLGKGFVHIASLILLFQLVSQIKITRHDGSL